jgi:hypothetical protein
MFSFRAGLIQIPCQRIGEGNSLPEQIFPTYRCANQAEVTTESFSRNWPTRCGVSVTTTTAFCTVDRVTSGGRLISRLESIWREQAIPKREVAGVVDVSFRQRVKYENSSVDLKSDGLVGLAQIGSCRGIAPGETKKGREGNACWGQGCRTDVLRQIGP